MSPESPDLPILHGHVASRADAITPAASATRLNPKGTLTACHPYQFQLRRNSAAHSNMEEATPLGFSFLSLMVWGFPGLRYLG